MRKFHFLLLLFTIQFSVEASSFYTRQNGQYDVASTWSKTSHTGAAATNPPCTCSPCNIGGSTTLLIAHAVTLSCNLTYSANSTVHIQSGGTLSVTGGASISGSATFIVDAGGTVNVSGDFSVSGGSATVTINGNLNITGNLSIGSSSTLCGTGTVTFGGSLTGAPCGTITTLPVTWLGFEAQCNKRKVTLLWETAAEINNDYFTVERSPDGISFNALARINGAGNSTQVNSYTWLDVNPMKGINYYRIKQTDYNGESAYSVSVAVNVTEEEGKITIAPTIVNGDHVTIYFNGMKNETAALSLSDITGSVLKNEMVFLPTNNEEMYYGIPSLLNGNICFITIARENGFDCRKIFIIR